MIKSAILLFNLLFLTIIAWAQEGIKVTQNVPPAVKQGSEFTIDVSIDKKGIEGFSKLQFALPVGLSASAVESNGATFSFKDQLVNFVWMSLPETESFKVSYKVSVSSTVFGEDSITGNFNYMHSNEKQTYRVPSMFIDIQLPGSASTPAASATTANNTKPIEQVIKPSVASLADTTKKITEEIKKEQAELPKEIESQKPTEEAVNTAKTELVETPKPAPIAPPVETPKPAEVIKPTVAEKPADAPKTAVVAKPIEAAKPVEKPKPAEVKVEKATPKTTGIPAKPGLIFKIQIAALGSLPKPGAFSVLSEISNFKSPEGLNKYYTGNFKTYDDASKHLVSVKEKGFEQAFIAAFKNGTPISVKEALGK